MLKKIIIVEKSKLKEGHGKNGPWTMYKVRTSEGNHATTFEDLPLDEELELEIIEGTFKGKDGKDHPTTTLKRKRTSGNFGELITKLTERTAAKFKEQDEKIKNLEAKVENLSALVIPPLEKPKEEKPEIPF